MERGGIRTGFMTTQCFCVSERSVKETARGFGEFVGWSDIYRFRMALDQFVIFSIELMKGQSSNRVE